MKPLHVAFVWHMHQPSYEREPAGSLSSPAGSAHGLLSLLQQECLIRFLPAMGCCNWHAESRPR